MGDFSEIIIVDKTSTLPLYMQIVKGFTQKIHSGHFRPGMKLPGARDLAMSLAIHRKTLQMALDEMLAQGWLEIVPRRGTFIARDLPDVAHREISRTERPAMAAETNFAIQTKHVPPFPTSDFQQSNGLLLSEGLPDIRLAPMKQLLREIRSLEKRGPFKKYFQYGDPQGTPYLRDTLAQHLNETRNLSITKDQIIITKGAQMGLYLAAHVILKPGDHVIVGDPGYVTATLTLQREGAMVHRVRVDDQGLNLDHVEMVCKRKKIRLVYVMPHHHHPTTVTLTPERRIRLLNLAQRYRFAIVEDDYDYDYHYASNPMLPMASLDSNGSVIYVGTLSKTLVPAVRVGFLVAPANFITEATNLRRAIDFQGDSMMEAAIAELFRSGVIASHIRKVVKTYHGRRDYFCNLLRTKLNNYVSFDEPQGGLCVWGRFRNIDLVKLVPHVEKMGLRMNDGSIYNTSFSSNATRLGFSTLTPLEQDKVTDIILRGIKQLNSLR